MDMQNITLFADGPHGGTTAAVVLDPTGLSDLDMQNVARRNGGAVGFMFAPTERDCDLALRFFTPNGEIAACPNTALAAVSLFGRGGDLPRDRIAISTPGGRIEGRATSGSNRTFAISQPDGEVLPVSNMHVGAILAILGIRIDTLAAMPVLNVRTGETKTLLPLHDAEALASLAPDLSGLESLCECLGSSGLYVYAPVDGDPRTFEARHFPRMSFDGEDAATATAATALAFGLRETGRVSATEREIIVRQGRFIGRPSRIVVQFRLDGAAPAEGCWLGGSAQLRPTAIAA